MKDSTPPLPFTVHATEHQKLFNWVTLLDQSSQNAINVGQSDETTHIQIGSCHMNDSQILEMQTYLSYNPNDMTYGLTTVVLPNIRISEKLRQAFERGWENEEDMEKMRSEISLPFMVGTIIDDLKRRLDPNKYQIAINEQHQTISINPVDAPEDQDPKYIMHLSIGDGSPLPQFCIHSEDQLPPPDADTFKAEYEEYARILEALVSSVYTSTSKQPRQSEYTLAPQKTLTRKLDQMQHVYDMRMRSLTNMGAIEDDGRALLQSIQVENPQTRFADIGGMQQAKTDLQLIVDSFRRPEVWSELGSRPPRSVFLYGEPGTGKTLLARAIAGEIGGKCLVVSIPSIKHWLYGKSEHNIDAIFDQADKLSEEGPVVIFFDEFEALAAERNGSEVTTAIVSTLLTKLDGFQKRGRNVVLIAATNLKDAVDKAVQRAGRFDLHVEVPKPDVAARKQIFDIHMGKIAGQAKKSVIGSSCQSQSLSEATEGFVGADIEEILRRVMDIKARERLSGKPFTPVTNADILNQIQIYRSEDRIQRRVGQSEEMGFLAMAKRAGLYPSEST